MLSVLSSSITSIVCLMLRKIISQSTFTARAETLSQTHDGIVVFHSNVMQ